MYVDDNGCWFQKECECGILAKKRLASRMRFANLPEAYKNAKLREIKNMFTDEGKRKLFSSSCKAISYWLEQFEEMQNAGKGLYLYSKTKGSGKTHMAACIANKLIQDKGISVKFASSIQILDEIRQTWDKSSDEYRCESQLIDALVTAPVLIIDDFGTEKVRDWVGEKFYSIINGRYVEKKVTIFTSNMNLNDLSYDERITNRIKERCYLIPFPEESIREQIANRLTEEMKGVINNYDSRRNGAKAP